MNPHAEIFFPASWTKARRIFALDQLRGVAYGYRRCGSAVLWFLDWRLL